MRICFLYSFPELTGPAARALVYPCCDFLQIYKKPKIAYMATGNAVGLEILEFPTGTGATRAKYNAF